MLVLSPKYALHEYLWNPGALKFHEHNDNSKRSFVKVISIFYRNMHREGGKDGVGMVEGVEQQANENFKRKKKNRTDEIRRSGSKFYSRFILIARNVRYTVLASIAFPKNEKRESLIT